jgi:hypothetical protein
MGLEAYLLNIEFKEPVLEQDIVGVFDKIGMTHLTDKFEKRTDKNYGSYYFVSRPEIGLHKNVNLWKLEFMKTKRA